MNIDVIITGLVSLAIGLTAQLFDKARSAREKRDIPLGLSEAHFTSSKWILIIVGTLVIIYGLFNAA
jgi:hypothetical protein